MDRRDAIKTTSLIMGYTLTGAAMTGFLSGCKADTSQGWKPLSLADGLDEFLAELAETILPRTDTPGAKDVLVHRFIDQLITDFYTEESRKEFLQNVKLLAEECRTSMGKSFQKLTEEKRVFFLMEQEKKGGQLPFSLWGNTLENSQNHTFYRSLKSMILWGYFSSEKIGKEVLTYNPIPGKYNGCIDLVKGQKI